MSDVWRPIETAPLNDVVVGLNRHGEEALIWRFSVPLLERWLTYYGSKPFTPTHWRPNHKELEVA